MALRNVLLLCGVIVGAGAVAGLSMQPHGSFPQSFSTSSNTFASNDQQPATPGSEAPPSYGPPQGASGPPGDQQQAPSQAPNGPYGGDGQARSNEPQLVALTQVDNADRILPRMPVEDSNGKPLGEVAQVLMHNGRPQEVLLDEGTRIPAGDLMYSPSRSVLIAQAPPRGTGG